MARTSGGTPPHPRRRGLSVGLMVLLAVAGTATAAQEQIVTDRPDFTESTDSVDRGRVQLESGYTFEEAGDTETQTFGEILVRIGWTEALELRLGVNSWASVEGPGFDDSGLEDASLGIKLELMHPAEGAGSGVPDVALLVETSLPTGASEFSQSGLQPGALLAFGWTVSERLSLGVNAGATYARDDDHRFFEGVASAALGIALGGPWSAYGEYYVFLPESSAGEATHFVDSGVTYLVSDDFQLDLRLGTGLAGAETDLIVGVGFAYRW